MLQKMKGFLPPSSRSFHGLYESFNGFNNDVGWRVSDSLSALKRIERALDAHDTHIKMLLWEVYRKDGETLLDAKKRFFRGIPKATGGLRTYQLCQTRLLKEFDAFCEEHGLRYVMLFGTLLGAVRHGGFIPWDDDIDLGMMRGEVQQLIRIVEDDERYRVTVVYDRFAFVRQVRFSYADPANPCFLDLFLLDYAKKGDPAPFEEMRADRQFMRDCVQDDPELAFWNVDNAYVGADEPGGDKIAFYFDEFIAAEYATEGRLTYDESEAGSIVWGIDNLDCLNNYRLHNEVDDFFPCKRMAFEDIELWAPRNITPFLVGPFQDYYTLPLDINSHYSHFDVGEFEEDDSKL